jgi:hypothetical protein
MCIRTEPEQATCLLHTPFVFYELTTYVHGRPILRILTTAAFTRVDGLLSRERAHLPLRQQLISGGG